MVGGCSLVFILLLSGVSRASPHDERSPEDKKVTVTDEQREYLRWLYRIEDPTVWKFVLLGLAFVCLLVGFLLLGMGAMASRNRRKIAKYKAAAVAAHRDQDETWPGGRDGALACGTPSPRSPTRRGPAPCNGDTGDVKAASIVVTWKDGNTSCLYPESEAEVGPPLPDDGEYRVRREDEEDEVKNGGDR
ncbi:solute carrier family 51 subunit beta [Hippocampus zosterae]|uniref:solute carrier family 51 subunit beta n=1 Tax=Hippocampus zosterae TaxID=109293 RepID=UPI00223E1C1C|nr:solute carrier family 51 subunit beta [Hippocampus zosterae]